MMWTILLITTIILIIFFSKIYFRGGKYNGIKPNLQGYYAIVTGGGNGIGLQVVKDLAKQGCEVIIADIVKSQHVATQINKSIKAEKVFYQYIDLGNLLSIQQFVNKLRWDKVDFLVNNAGIMGLKTLIKTKSNFQAHFGINYIGHFYLTHLLWSRLQKSKFFRIVILSSMAHRKIGGFGKQTTLQFGKFNFQNSQYDRMLAYSRSKLYLAIFARALGQIVQIDKGIAVAVHPGIARTALVSNMYTTSLQKIKMKILFPLIWLFTKNTVQASQTILYTLYSDKKQLKSGCYYSDCKVSQGNPLIQRHWKKMFELTQELLKIEYGK